MKYEVKTNGKKLLDDFRGDRIYGDCYIILKNDKEAYEVVLSEIGDMCSCLAGKHGHSCKHIKMAIEHSQLVKGG